MELEKKENEKKKKPRVCTEKLEVSNVVEVKNGNNIEECLGMSDMDAFRKLTAGLIKFHKADHGGAGFGISVNYSLGVLNELKPRDLLEYHLITQMIMTHQLFEKASTRANVKDQNPARIDEYVKNMSKLSRLYLNQLKELTRYRNNGQQKVKVEHVHISDGGQAVFGDISTGGGKK